MYLHGNTICDSDYLLANEKVRKTGGLEIHLSFKNISYVEYNIRIFTIIITYTYNLYKDKKKIYFNK